MESKRPETLNRLYLLLGPLGAITAWSLPLGFTYPQSALLGIVVWMVLWWITEAIPLGMTGIFGITLSVITGVSSAQDAFFSFAHPLIFLFMGGFFIAKAMSANGLDRRMALFLLTRETIHNDPWKIIVSLILFTAFASMWISNTATTAMMLPIAMGVLAKLFPEDKKHAGIVLIAIAWASSIGGTATLVGSTPNMIVAAALDQMAGYQITLFEWMRMAAPISILTLLFLIYLLKKRLPKLESSFDSSFLKNEYLELGTLSRAEINTAIALGTAVVLWIFPGLVSILFGKTSSIYLWFRDHIPEPIAALLGASLLFILPKKDGSPTLKWKEAITIDWNSLLIFGAGLSMGTMMFSTGLAQRLGTSLTSGAISTPILFLLTATYLVIFMTELTSNTATANMVIPLVIAGAQNIGISTKAPAVAVAISCSLAFMMPISTPPNAIVYGSGWIKLSAMIKKGFLMNIVAGLIIVGVAYVYSFF